ncbi:MAG: hemolysin family protein [Pseudomonadota bacterium]
MDILLLVFLILLNGLFAMGEMAIVSSRKARLQHLVDEGKAGAAEALALQETPSRFLSTIQVGITSIAILSGMVGEDALVDPLAQWLQPLLADVPVIHDIVKDPARAAALTITVVTLTYFSVVIGELVPKQLALLAPERIARTVAKPMRYLSWITFPLVSLFSASAGFVLRVLGARGRDEPPVTNEEIKVLMEQGAEAGIFHASERELVANVLHLDDQTVRAIMTPRQDIDGIDLDENDADLKKALAGTRHSRILAYRGDYNHIAGILHAGDLLRRLLAGETPRLADCVRPAHFVPDTVTLSQLLDNLRRARTAVALVVDEYGDLQGLVTLKDVTDAIVGSLALDEDTASDIVQRADGSWLVDGSVSLERLKQALDSGALPGEEEGDFHTAAGFVLHTLGHIPKAAEHFTVAGYRFEVVDMDGNRIDKLLVSMVPEDTHVDE